MDSKLRLKLQIGDTHIIIGTPEDGTPYRLLASGLEGIESAETVLTFADSAQYDGGTVLSARVPGREIRLLFEIADYDNRDAYREALISFFKPRTIGTLTVSRYAKGLPQDHDRTIGCMLWGNVEMTQESMYDYIRVAVTLYCPDPYFYAESVPRVLSRTGAALLYFPMTVTASSGMTVGLLKTDDRLSVWNNGDTETGFLINITASEQTPGAGAAFEDPCLTHLESGAYIRIRDTLDLGDTVTVCTLPGAKYILKNGERRMNFDVGSTFFSLQPGENTLVLSARAHLGALEAVVSFRTRHFGA